MISMVHGISRFHAELSTGLQVYSSGLPSAKQTSPKMFKSINQSLFPNRQKPQLTESKTISPFYYGENDTELPKSDSA